MQEKIKIIWEKYRFFLIIVLVGFVLVLIPTSCEQKEEVSHNHTLQGFSVETLQKEIEDILKQTDGVGRVKLMLTLKSGIEQIYAEDARVTQDTQESESNSEYRADSDKRPSVISDSTGAETPVLIKQIYPEFLGATVVCDGAENARVRSVISDTIGALTGITADRIAIIKMKP